jgi:hypothetical protein
MTATTELHLVLHLQECVSKLFHLVVRASQLVEHQSQGGLAAYAGQLRELLNGAFQ